MPSIEDDDDDDEEDEYADFQLYGKKMKKCQYQGMIVGGIPLGIISWGVTRLVMRGYLRSRSETLPAAIGFLGYCLGAQSYYRMCQRRILHEIPAYRKKAGLPPLGNTKLSFEFEEEHIGKGKENNDGVNNKTSVLEGTPPETKYGDSML